MKRFEKEFLLKMKSEKHPDAVLSKDYVYLNYNTMKLMKDFYPKWDGNKHPKQRPIVRISREGLDAHVYRRIFNGNSLGVNEDELLLDWEALSYLKAENNDTCKLIIKKSWCIPFYSNHFDSSTRWAFRLSIISLGIGLISALIGLISLGIQICPTM